MGYHKSPLPFEKIPESDLSTRGISAHTTLRYIWLVWEKEEDEEGGGCTSYTEIFRHNPAPQ